MLEFSFLIRTAKSPASTTSVQYSRPLQRKPASSRREAPAPAPILAKTLSLALEPSLSAAALRLAARVHNRRQGSGETRNQRQRHGRYGQAGGLGRRRGGGDAGRAIAAEVPGFGDLQRRAKWRVARFAYDFVTGGVGDGAPNVAHNRAAMDAVRIVPRYAVDLSGVNTATSIFGRDYAAPVGVAPMGNVGMVWPRANAILAAAAQAARIPYVSSTVANVGMEELARIAPDSLWFQLYGMPADNHRLSLDMIRRAEAVGAHALVITLDVPMRQKRVHDVRNGLVVPFKYRPRTVLDIARAPFWALEMLQKGQPRFENMREICRRECLGRRAGQVRDAEHDHRRHLGRHRPVPRDLAARPGAEGHPAPGGC